MSQGQKTHAKERTEVDKKECRVVNHTDRAVRGTSKRETKVSKSNCYKEWCREADANPWGNAYLIVMVEIGGKTTPIDKLKFIVEKEITLEIQK